MTAPMALVTGADGFIGSHLVERLMAEGYRVRALCLYTPTGRPGWLAGLASSVLAEIDVRLGDIRDPEFVRDCVAGSDIVFHLAALIAIPYSYTAPRSVVETNVLGSLNVFEAARREGGIRVIHTSTSEVYGTPREVPISESHPLHGQSPYSASKIGADALAEAWSRSFETPISVLRPFNTYGPRQSSRAIIPVLLEQMLAGRSEIRVGSTAPRRDFTYVSDTVEGFIRVAGAEPLPPGEVVQLGSGRDVSIAELIDLCRAVTGSRAEIVQEEERMRPSSSEVDRLLSSPARAAERLGWRPRVDLETGLALTAEWLAPRLDPASVGAYQR